MLVLSKYVAWEEFRDVLVVPRAYRGKILIVAHEKTGHLGGDKVVAMIERHFAWPGMVKEAYNHCKECPTCQVKSKHVPRKAPVVERPVLTEPFEDVCRPIA